jgi:hypothetical protein
MSEELPFDPMPFMEDPHRQTIVSAFFNVTTEPPSVCHLIQLSDGDKLAIEISTPPNWKASDATVLLVHGLCGSHRSPNLVRMVKKLEPYNIRTVRFNMRGCGSGKGLSKHIYHCGRSDDVFEAVKFLKKQHPSSPLTLVGFSLGGNLVLKMAGELGPLGSHFLNGVIAICPPCDLLASVRMFSDEANQMYEKYFYKLMREEVHYRHGKFKELPRINLPKQMKIYEFDQHYVVPTAGFADVMDYYQKCSAVNFAEEIRLPTKILFAMDDPIISPFCLDGCNLHENVKVYKTKKGGHMGYLTSPANPRGVYWLDSLLEDWIRSF